MIKTCCLWSLALVNTAIAFAPPTSLIVKHPVLRSSSVTLSQRQPLTTLTSTLALDDGESSSNVNDGAAVKKGGSSVSASVFNLAKNIMGAGAISLPAAIGAIGDTKGAILPAVAVLLTMASLSAFTFCVIGKEVSAREQYFRRALSTLSFSHPTPVPAVHTLQLHTECLPPSPSPPSPPLTTTTHHQPTSCNHHSPLTPHALPSLHTKTDSSLRGLEL